MANLFGWQLIKDEKDPSGYIHIKNGEHFIGGIPPAQHRDPNAPPHWLVYFQVADVEATTAKVDPTWRKSSDAAAQDGKRGDLGHRRRSAGRSVLII